MFILLTLLVVQRLVGFLRVVLFCRWLEPAELGKWDLAFGFLMLAGPISVLALSSSFGRYLEHYRQRLQVRAMLRRTAIACAAFASVSASLLCLLPERFAELIFGAADQAWMVPLVAGTLLAIVAYNYLTDLSTALRNARLYAGLQLISSVAFAGFGIALLQVWRATAGSVILAYGGATVVSCLVGWAWIARHRGMFPDDGPPPAHREFWNRLLPFTASVWLTSLMANLFELSGRWMIAHFSAGNPAGALAAVGDYHSSRVMPLLLVSVAQLIAPMILPHLSRDWEEGRRDRVGARLNLHLKVVALGMSAGAVAVLWFAPLLFHSALAGKYAGGLAVLPLTLTYCTWLGLWSIAQNYLLCAERARLGSLALTAGMGVNIALNLLLLPRFGLQGAVVASAAANLAALVLILLFARRLGFRLDRGTAVVLAIPAVFVLGPWVTLAVLLAVAWGAIGTARLFSPEEKGELWSLVRRGRSLVVRTALDPQAGPG